MTDQRPATLPIEDGPALIVEALFDGLRDKDWKSFASAMDEHISYHNVGIPIIRGRYRTVAFLRRLLDRRRASFDVKIHRIAVDGSSVLTERTDMIVLGPFRLRFWVCGVFEVANDEITLWRDYFDFFDVLKGTARGVVGMVVPSLQPTL